MTNSIDEQIAFLQSQKQAINEPYRIGGRRDGGRGGMRNRIGYDTYDTYGRPSHKDDKEEKILTMLMLQLMLNIMIMLNCLKNGLVII